MLRQEMTRKQVAAFILSGKDDNIDKSLEEGCRYTREQLEAVNDYIDYLVGEFTDEDLAYDTLRGFFVYVGPELPKIEVER